jgi:hypothetical protein
LLITLNVISLAENKKDPEYRRADLTQPQNLEPGKNRNSIFAIERNKGFRKLK